MWSKLRWCLTALFLPQSKPQRPCTLVVLCVRLAQGVSPGRFWGESVSPSGCGNEEEQDCSCLHVLSPPTLISYCSSSLLGQNWLLCPFSCIIWPIGWPFKMTDHTLSVVRVSSRSGCDFRGCTVKAEGLAHHILGWSLKGLGISVAGRDWRELVRGSKAETIKEIGNMRYVSDIGPSNDSFS